MLSLFVFHLLTLNSGQACPMHQGRVPRPNRRLRLARRWALWSLSGWRSSKALMGTHLSAGREIRARRGTLLRCRNWGGVVNSRRMGPHGPMNAVQRDLENPEISEWPRLGRRYLGSLFLFPRRRPGALSDECASRLQNLSWCDDEAWPVVDSSVSYCCCSPPIREDGQTAKLSLSGPGLP